MSGNVPVRVMVPVEDYQELLDRAAHAGFDRVGPWLLSLTGVESLNPQRMAALERRRRILHLHGQGLTNGEISVKTGEVLAHIQQTVRDAGRSPNRKAKKR